MKKIHSKRDRLALKKEKKKEKIFLERENT
jgi:hypothetical protein